MHAALGGNVFTTFGLPPDEAAWLALGAAVVLFGVALARPLWLTRLQSRFSSRVALVTLSGLAALLSVGYLLYYLKGGPRIIDATSYWLEARALADGLFAFPVPAPSGSFRGRFLVTPPGAAGDSMAVIFPPGWPAVLALGFFVRAPLLIGPLIGGLLVWGTFTLARQLFERRDVALLAAGLSALCATLRYHTADTMSHGWSALLFVWTVSAALSPRRVCALLAGLACGWLVATRPVTGAVAILITTSVLAQRSRLRAAGAAFGAGLLPGVLLLLWHQHAATGSWLSPAQLYYYALSDGPPGCFRYGFGAGIGCVYEHGDVVRAHLANGYGAGRALLNTLHRLFLHSGDIANAEPFALCVPLAIIAGRSEYGVRLLAIAVGLLVLAYAPFYFEGSYPGGGARMLADVLPFEHVLVAWSLVRLKLQRFAAPAALAGFALHTSHAHAQLSAREGGRPMYEPNVAKRAGIERGLIFVGTDHGFNLGHVPGLIDPQAGLVVARARNDAHDALLWQRLGKPASYSYAFEARDRAVGSLSPYRPPDERVLRFEAEAEWPPLSLHGGWAHPDFAGSNCASRGRGLRFRANAGGALSATLEIVTAEAGPHRIACSWIATKNGELNLSAKLGRTLWRGRHFARRDECWRSESPQITLGAGPHRIVVTSAHGSEAILDYIEVLPSFSPALK